MPNHPTSGASAPIAQDSPPALDRWTPPAVEVICLACEVSAYAPDGDFPLL